MNRETEKEIAFNLIKRFDPESTNHFDEMWKDYSDSEDATGIGGKHRLGIGVDSIFWAVIIIPLVNALSKKLIDLSVDKIVEFIKNYRNGESTPQDVEVANAVIEEWNNKAVESKQ
jgi:hypothetical protein